MKTWNHLCANLPKAEKSDWWALYSPFVVRSEGPGLTTGIQLFAHPVAAFLEFHARAVDSMKTGQQLESEILSDDAGFPVLRVRSADRDESSDRPPASTITLEPVIQPHIDPVHVGRAHPDRPTHAMNGVRR
ncbi:hypothetical protein FSB08_26255 [Paraburkholderia sp. JPY432]|uniref:hypothetical protein n=1 Tax=Paraburkholderia youngii TaxID=2782701 RepID=UPI0015954BAA|nr:hypothetical protein [Paraburkholderia youngii]NVH75940.1 hypothetical protein [Paraburkholderia youngii]